MKIFGLFVLKLFLYIFPIALTVVLISSVFIGISFLVYKTNRKLIPLYFLFVYVFFLYVFGAFGAIYREIFDFYCHQLPLRVFVIIAGFFAFVLWQAIATEANIRKLKIKEDFPNYGYNGTDFLSREDIVDLAIYNNLKGSWMVFISYIIFVIYPSFIDKLYGSFPEYIATLFT